MKHAILQLLGVSSLGTGRLLFYLKLAVFRNRVTKVSQIGRLFLFVFFKFFFPLRKMGWG